MGVDEEKSDEALEQRILGEMSVDDGGAVVAYRFPPEAVSEAELDKFGLPRISMGMSLRDWFAGQAMQGIESNPGKDYYPNHLGKRAYLIADAMIAEKRRTFVRAGLGWKPEKHNQECGSGLPMGGSRRGLRHEEVGRDGLHVGWGEALETVRREV